MKVLAYIVVVVLLLSGVSLIAYARWSQPIVDADSALASGQFDTARALYETAEARFDKTPVARQFLAAEYAHVVAGHLTALYDLKRYEDTIDLADHAPVASSPHFWSGCAFFEKGAAEEKPDARL